MCSPRIHRFEQTQILPVPLEEAWAFFSEPKNLDSMTPPELAFDTQSGDDEAMFPGQIIVHRIQILPKIWTTWVTEIVETEERSYFIDEQRFGPYKFWHHLHRFEACDEGTRMLDRVHYALPFHPFSAPMNGLFIRPQLEHIFQFRRKVLEERFPGGGASLGG